MCEIGEIGGGTDARSMGKMRSESRFDAFGSDRDWRWSFRLCPERNVAERCIFAFKNKFVGYKRFKAPEGRW